MFALLAGGLWSETLNPWVQQCNTDKTDCQTFWRKSRTAYMSENQTLTGYLQSVGAYAPAGVQQEDVPVAQVVPDMTSQ